MTIKHATPQRSSEDKVKAKQMFAVTAAFACALAILQIFVGAAPATALTPGELRICPQAGYSGGIAHIDDPSQLGDDVTYVRPFNNGECTIVHQFDDPGTPFYLWSDLDRTHHLEVIINGDQSTWTDQFTWQQGTGIDVYLKTGVKNDQSVNFAEVWDR